MRPALLLAMTVIVAVAGCGQKGPLYLRDNPPPGVKPPRPEPYRPVPYPDDRAREDADSARK